jgi:MoxR-like ATPase
VSDEILAYIGQIVRETRELPQLVLGASPRAAIALLLGGKVLAALRGRDFVLPDDVKELAFPALRHRLILRAEAEIEGLTPERVIEALLSRVPVPR